MELSEYYINRNVGIIKAYNALVNSGIKTREALQRVATQYSVSYSLISAVIYTEGYAYREEALKRIEDEKKREKRTS